MTAYQPMPVEPHHDDGATWHRLSPRMLVVHPLVILVRFVPLLVILLLAHHGNSGALVGDGVAAVLVTLLALSRWFTTYLRVTATSVQLREGLLRRRTRTTARDRIRTVDLSSHPLHRLLGLTRVVIGTGTSDRRGRERMVLDGLPLATARQLQNELLHRDHATAADAGPTVGWSGTAAPYEPSATSGANGWAAPDAATMRPAPSAGSVRPAPGAAATWSASDAEAVELARLDLRWLRFAPFTLAGLTTGLVLWGVFWRLQGEGVNLLGSGPLRHLRHDAGRASLVLVVLVLVAAAVVFVVVTSLLGYVLAFWQFRLLRRPEGTIQVTRGLLTTRATSIEERRLVGVEVSQGLALRAVGGARLLAVATGLRVGRGAERGGEALLPPAPHRVVDRVADALLGGADASGGELVPHGPAARRRRLTRVAAPTAVLLIVAVVGFAVSGVWWQLLVVAVAAVLAAPLALDRYRGLGHRVADGRLTARLGSLVRRRTTIDADAVIGWNLRRSPFQRRAGLVTLVATTAAGRQGVDLVDVDTERAVQVAGAVTPGLLDAFRVGSDSAVIPAVIPRSRGHV